MNFKHFDRNLESTYCFVDTPLFNCVCHNVTSPLPKICSYYLLTKNKNRVDFSRTRLSFRCFRADKAAQKCQALTKHSKLCVGCSGGLPGASTSAGWAPTSQILTQPLPPVYTWRVGLLRATAHTTSPWPSVASCRACRGSPGAPSASPGNCTGCIWPSADTWNE